ncbi:MAG: hypothetical protein IJI46_00630 [Erysipelotrichaceae bacterium]|nr:hypothetical protein [Erysipelotrichaceae bacterium]
MKYLKVKASLKEAPKRFYRVVAIREDADLFETGVILGNALNCEFEHLFMFRKGQVSYTDGSWGYDGHFYFNMNECTLKDLGDKFTFIYDFGDDWEFDCKVYSKAIEKDSDEIAILLDGKGQGIWEDQKWVLMRYLDGELDPDLDEENEDEGICFPWNFEIEKLSDFDTEYDLEFEQEDFDVIVRDRIDVLRSLRDRDYEKPGPYFDEEDDDYEFSDFSPQDEERAKQDFVDVQIQNYLLICDMLEEFSAKYPEESEEELLERVRQELLKMADHFLDDLSFYLDGINVSKDVH